jgi:hypothetical protein
MRILLIEDDEKAARAVSTRLQAGGRYFLRIRTGHRRLPIFHCAMNEELKLEYGN